MPTLIIQSYTFQVQHPYAAGQPLGPAEAQVLNTLRCKNLQRTFGKRVAEVAAGEPSGALRAEQLEELREAFQRLDQGYQFPLKHEGVGQKLGLLEREALQVARERALQLAQQAGRTIGEAEIAQAAELLAGQKTVQEEAHRRVAARSALAAEGLEALL